MIPHFLALDVGFKNCQVQLCSSIRGCHATFLVKNTLFKGEVVCQPLRELQICFSSILEPHTRAFKWGIVSLSIIIAFGEISGYVKKCLFLRYKINFFDIITYICKSYDSRKTFKFTLFFNCCGWPFITCLTLLNMCSRCLN